jgi:serine protease AprX
MSRMLKVFAAAADQGALAANHNVIEKYDAFVVVDVSDSVAKQLEVTYLVEDITDQYKIPLGGEVQADLNTNVPRITSAGRTRSHPDYKGLKAPGDGVHHYLVQFRGPVKAQWLAAVKKAGAEVVDTQSGFTVVVRASAPAVAKVAALESVRWCGHLPTEARLNVEVAADAPRTRVLPDAYVVEFFTPREAKKAKATIRKLGYSITADETDVGMLVVEQPSGTQAAQRRQLQELSRVHGVRSVRRRAMNRISNDVAITIMHATPADLVGVASLDGSGEIVGICDTGFDVGTSTPVHPDFAGRVKSVSSYPITAYFAPFILNPGADDGAADLDSGHGTHVSGSVLGDGTASVALAGHARIHGVASKAKLVFQAVEQQLQWKNPADLQKHGRFILAGIPADLTVLLDDAYRKGVRIHSNSWGGGDEGAYDSQCRQIDQFIWDHPNMCVLIAAGNDGSDADADGKINLGSVTPPGTAKNCITVGASENLRPEFNTEHYGSPTWWARSYPVAPYKDAPMADNADQVVPFSSRGPTGDGRIKPDVVAPGSWILSTKSTMLSATATGWSPFPPSPRYFYMGGTSMATPLTAGAVAALRQHLRRDRGVTTPSAALLKATLIAGAARLPDTAAAGVVADTHQGFGRVDIGAIAAPGAGVKLMLQQTERVATGQSRNVTVNVTGSSVPLRVVLVYTDAAGAALVNNLNLVVTLPDGSRRVGNQTAGSAPTFDTANNVEVVQIDNPQVGTYAIDVIGSNVPLGPQRYALVVRGKLQ